MNLPTFLIAVFSLLILPGPTNAVLALASTALTVRGSLSLVTTVVLGYLAVIIPVSSIAAPLLEGHPAIAAAVKLISAIWVLYLTLKLWVPVPVGGQSTLGVGQLFVTTLLNPKAIIIGLTLVPSVQTGIAVAIAAFVCCATVTSAIWLGLGGLLVGRHAHMPPLVLCGIAVAQCWSPFPRPLPSAPFGPETCVDFHETGSADFLDSMHGCPGKPPYAIALSPSRQDRCRPWKRRPENLMPPAAAALSCVKCDAGRFLMSVNV